LCVIRHHWYMPRGVKRTGLRLRIGKDFLMWLQVFMEKLPERINMHDSGCWSYRSADIKNPPNVQYQQKKGEEFSIRVSRLILAWKHDPNFLRKGRKMVAMHLCDQPWCVNPDHLKIGTQQENVQDCVAKGRRRGPHPHYS
jgi:hypothetical protein